MTAGSAGAAQTAACGGLTYMSPVMGTAGGERAAQWQVHGVHTARLE